MKGWRWITAGALEVRYLLLALGIGLAFGGYFVLRYGGYWAEQDSQFFVLRVAWMIDAGRIFYPEAYTHGFAYPLWASTLSLLTGLDVGEMLRVYTPLLGNVFLALMGFVFFRNLLGSDRLGLVATMALFLVPELVFTVSRGNHEKLTVVFALLASLALYRGFVEMMGPRRWGVFVAWSLIYHLLAFVLITVNLVFGFLFVLAWSLAYLFLRGYAWGLGPRHRWVGPTAQRIALVIGTAWIMGYAVVWHVYPLAQVDLSLVRDAFEARFSPAEAGTLQEPLPNPYAAIEEDWVSVQAYSLITAFRWVLFAGSGITALVMLSRALLRRSTLRLPQSLLLALYVAFGLEMVGAVLADLAGLTPGSNLQVRVFSYFVLVAVPLWVIGATSFVQYLARWVPRPLLQGAVGLVIAFFAVSSLLKATLDPLVSNHWLVYHPAEVEAMRTWATNVNHKVLWVGAKHRLAYAWVQSYSEVLPGDNLMDGTIRGGPKPRATYAINSTLNQANMIALGVRIPPRLIGDRIYDNGVAQIYRRVSQTLYER
ncbi:hypothetical protein [Marinithermus hydrothermalis]|uniref:Glycosyltransferase RgtA/B/C/D-like domain-containing protein n=1 Tax=Marinithermus hydrothermalis (strain DSM 14884 / JCM 11576 / T1) TaxID=869210 RepID=F2NKF0_MARHT|nr:hypothetical protein [Marinithermus hydrothermalis]AEB12399.1 hypothetical protein Marky_1664 [Marinithermus hydrothermalis DSM 14884]